MPDISSSMPLFMPLVTITRQIRRRKKEREGTGERRARGGWNPGHPWGILIGSSRAAALKIGFGRVNAPLRAAAA